MIYQVDDGATGEHGPAHVHVIKAGERMVINLAPISIRDIAGMGRVNVRAAVRTVEDHQTRLLAEWGRING